VLPGRSLFAAVWDIALLIDACLHAALAGSANSGPAPGGA
jgi:hypothetical protein